MLDGKAVVGRVWQAIGCHTTQATPYDGISAALTERFVRFDHLIRRRPPWCEGDALEDDLSWPSMSPTHESTS